VIESHIYDPDRDGPLLTPSEAQRYLWENHKIRRSLHRLADLRCFGGGPPFIKQNRREVRYPQKLVENWATQLNAKPVLTVGPAAVETHLRSLQGSTRVGSSGSTL
jgi:hypothetical protein